MAMHNPPHPGEFISTVYLEPNALSGRELATKLGVAPSTLNRVLTGASGVSPEMALRLSKCLGRSPESCLTCRHPAIHEPITRRSGRSRLQPARLRHGS